MNKVDEAKQLLSTMGESELRQVRLHLASLLPKHPVEEALMVSSDGILYALERAGEFSTRMIRGVFAEAAFAADVLPGLAPSWKEVPRGSGDPPYDFRLTDRHARPSTTEIPFSEVRVQVKMQRSEAGKPLPASKVWRSRVKWPPEFFVVEVQKSRKGDKQGKSTRPYRFGEFDILAVSLGPSTGRWGSFVYTVERWLMPDPESPDCLLTYQPVSPVPNGSWTDEFTQAVRWLRGGVQKQIEGDVPKQGKQLRRKPKD